MGDEGLKGSPRSRAVGTMHGVNRLTMRAPGLLPTRMWASSNILLAAQTLWPRRAVFFFLSIFFLSQQETRRGQRISTRPASSPHQLTVVGSLPAHARSDLCLPPGSKQCSVGMAIADVLPGCVRARPILLTSQPCSCIFSGRRDGALPGRPGFIRAASGCLRH